MSGANDRLASGILLTDGDKHRLVDYRGRKVYELSGLGSDQIRYLSDQMTLSVAEDDEPRIQNRVVVDFLILDHRSIAKSLSYLCECLASVANTRIEIHSEAPLGDSEIDQFLKFVADLQSFGVVSGPIRLCGRFKPGFADEKLEAILAAGCVIQYCVGQDGERLNNDDLESIRELTDFGFFTPVATYVSSRNLSFVNQEIEKAMSVNRAAGFSLPLISSSLFFDSTGELRPPSSEAYCELLVSQYESYPANDQYFEPVNELARAIGYGSTWSKKHSVHRTTNLIFGKHGCVDVFRQIPDSAVKWVSFEQILSMASDQLCDSFFVFIADQFLWERNPQCCDCRWRYVCGGLDSFNDTPLAEDLFRSICDYRQVFMEHFGLSNPAGIISQVNNQDKS